MGAPPMKFEMPMFNGFVPECLRPWIYVFIACCFQLSGGRYLGPINELIGAHGNMREDIVMCMMANLSGMALWFPMLFRMKFRFTNKTLLRASSVVVIITNILTMQITSLPLLWFVCFVEGIAKIQGTFECMSNIQLWMTSKRDMKVFFPLLHVIILSAICAQKIVSSWFGYLGDWELMHWLVIGLHCIVLLILTTCVHHFRFMKMPLFGIDWTGLVLWAALLLQIAFMLVFGEFYDWFNQRQMWYVLGFTLITFALIFGRMNHVRHPYVSPRVFTGFKKVKPIFMLIVLYEMILASENVMEEVFYEHGLEYNTIVNASLTWWVWAGNIFGCLFSLVWLRKVIRFSYIRLGIVGTCFLTAYVLLMYMSISSELNIEALRLPLFCRGVAYACMSIMFMNALHDATDFPHFFQCLSVFNMLHMVVGGCIGTALYGHGLNYFMADGMARCSRYLTLETWQQPLQQFGPFMEELSNSMLVVACKTLYGWVAYACVALIIAFFFFDSPLRRRHPRLMQPWEVVGQRLGRRLISRISAHNGVGEWRKDVKKDENFQEKFGCLD